MADLMDIGTVKETTDVILYHPVNSEILRNDDGSEMTITVYSPYSKHVKAVTHAQMNRRLQRAQRTGGRLNTTSEELDASSMDLLVKSIASWNITLGGTKPEFTEAKVREVFEKLPWVREQVDQGVGDLQGFLEK